MAAETQILEPLTIIVPDTPPDPDATPVVVKPEAKEPKAEKVAKPEPSTDDAVAKLTKQLESKDAEAQEAKRQRDAANAQAQTHQREAAGFRTQAEQARYDSIVTAQESANARMTALETEMADAMERGDFKASAKAQAEMTRLAPRLAQLEDGKADMDEVRKNPPAPVVTQPAVPSDPVEAYVQKMAPESAAWVRAHPEFVTDRVKNRMLIAAHELAVGRGMVANSGDYLADVERTLGLSEGGQRTDPNETPPQRSPEQERERRPAAPPTRGMPANGSVNGSGTRITLTAEMRQTARQLDMTDEEYAANLQKARRDGRLN